MLTTTTKATSTMMAVFGNAGVLLLPLMLLVLLLLTLQLQAAVAAAGGTRDVSHREARETADDENFMSRKRRRRLPVSEIFRDLGNNNNRNGGGGRDDDGDDDDDARIVKAMIGYRTPEARQRLEEALGDRVNGTSASKDFSDVNVPAVAVEASLKKLKEIEFDPDVEYIEKDDLLYPLNIGEQIPYGLKMIQSNRIRPKKSSAVLRSGNGGGDDSSQRSCSCSRKDSFKVAIIDSGTLMLEA